MRQISACVIAALLAAAISAFLGPSRGAAAIRARVDAKKSTGMVVATIEADGSHSIAAYGDPGPRARPLDADSVFEIGSITKVFTAILLAEMSDRGELRLDDPVVKYLPAGVRVPERNG